MRSAEVENFSFGIFDNETKTVEKIRKNIITAEKMRVGNMERFVLTYEKTIIDKQKNRNRNIENFKPIF